MAIPDYKGYAISTGKNESGEWFAAAHPPGMLATREGNPGIRGFDTEQEAVDAVQGLVDSVVVDSEGSSPDVHEYGRYTIRTGQNVHRKWFALAHVTGASIMRKDDPGVMYLYRGTEQDAIDAVHELIDAME